MDDVLVDEVAGLMEKRASNKEDGRLFETFARKTFHGNEPKVKVLYIGPFVLDSVLQLKSNFWKERLENEYDIQTEMVIGDPPFHADDIECKGYWLKPDGRTYEARVKKLKQQVSQALISLMAVIEKVRPRMIIGEGQGGVVVSMSTFPTILERACRDRAVTDGQMRRFREAWAGVVGVLVVDPLILPVNNHSRGISFNMLREALPMITWNQPRNNRRAMLQTGRYMAGAFAEEPVSYTHLTLPTKA